MDRYVVMYCYGVDAFVRSFDPDAHDGCGHVVWTDDPERAQRFPDASAAAAFWKLQSTVRPTRDDGKPNRPLTAYTASIVTVTVD